MQNKDKSNLASEIISYSSLWNASLKVLEKQISEKKTQESYTRQIELNLYLSEFVYFSLFYLFILFYL